MGRLSSPALPQDISPAIRRARSLSNRRRRQIWIIWTGQRIALRNSYRQGRGTLIARVIGDDIFPADQELS